MTYSAYKKTKQGPLPDKEWGGSLNIQPTFTPKFTTIKAHAFFYILGLIVFLYLGLKVLDYANRYRAYETITTNLMHKAYHLVMPKLTAQDTAPQPAPQNDTTQGATGQNTPPQTASQPGTETQGNAPTNTPAPTKAAKKKNEKESAFDPLGITSPSQVRLLESLGARHQELDNMKRELERRELELKLYEKKLQEKYETINTIQEEVKRQLGELDKAEIVKQKSLSEVFSIMNPKAAAAIFDKHTMPIVMEIIRHMKERKLSEILSFVSVERAKEITEELAMRSESLAKKNPQGNLGTGR